MLRAPSEAIDVRAQRRPARVHQDRRLWTSTSGEQNAVVCSRRQRSTRYQLGSNALICTGRPMAAVDNFTFVFFSLHRSS